MRSMGEQTVTAYRKTAEGVTCRVVRGCFLHREERLQEDALGKHICRDFLLIVPPGGYIPRVGDRVLEGVGPKQVDWESFVPGIVPGLVALGVVEEYRFRGKLHHYEARFR